MMMLPSFLYKKTSDFNISYWTVSHVAEHEKADSFASSFTYFLPDVLFQPTKTMEIAGSFSDL